MHPKPTRAYRSRQRAARPRIERHAIQELLWPGSPGVIFRSRRVQMEVLDRQPATADGGLALAHQLVTRLKLDQCINERLHLLKVHLPYYESDHVLTHAYNLFIGGRYIEDIANLQHSDAVKNLLGAVRIPDPTTAGDFLRRFQKAALGDLQASIDTCREKVWRKMPRSMRESITLDMDSTFKEVYGECKQGAEFSYKGKWSYHPLLFTLAETSECLRLINRPGNRPSAEGAAEELGPCLELLRDHFKRVYLRGDSKFSEKAILRQAIDHGAYFAIVHEISPEIRHIAWNLAEAAWEPFEGHRGHRVRSSSGMGRSKRRKWRRKIASRRGYRTLSTAREWVAEVPFTPRGFNESLRLVIKRKLIHDQRQVGLFTHYEYQAVISNIPCNEMSRSEITGFAYKRCNQENAIEQAKNGLRALQMPTGELLANGAYLLAAQLAWNLRAWLSLLALPKETRTWEWGWFRRVFVHVPANIVSHARSARVRISGSHRFATHVLAASRRLASLTFG